MDYHFSIRHLRGGEATKRKYKNRKRPFNGKKQPHSLKCGLLCGLLSSNEFVDCDVEDIRKFPQRFDIRRISPDFVITDKGFRLPKRAANSSCVSPACFRKNLIFSAILIFSYKLFSSDKFVKSDVENVRKFPHFEYIWNVFAVFIIAD